MAYYGKYQLNESYFNTIDSFDKAYWLGFIWGDGSVIKRTRGAYVSCELKIGISERDIEHLYLFNQYLESNLPVHTYEIKSGFSSQYKEARLMISRKALASHLYDLGIRPGRTAFNKLLPHVPKEYHLDLMRGIIDSDGGFTQKDIQYNGSRGQGVIRTEYSIHLIANPEVLDFYNNLLIENGITKTVYKRFKRHKDADGNVLSIQITGNNMVEKIGDLLYKDKEHISLKRKYEQYIGIKSYMDEYREEKVRYEN